MTSIETTAVRARRARAAERSRRRRADSHPDPGEVCWACGDPAVLICLLKIGDGGYRQLPWCGRVDDEGNPACGRVDDDGMWCETIDDEGGPA